MQWRSLCHLMLCHYTSPSLLRSTAHWENGRAEQCAVIQLANQSRSQRKKQLQALFQMQPLETVRNGRGKAVSGNQKLEAD